MSRLTVNVSPHIHTSRTTQKIMLDVVISLLPICGAATYLFGLRALALIAACAASAVFFEWLFNRSVKKEQTIGDLSAVVTGILLALNLPADMPFWQAILGSAFAIVVVKGLFGGIGQNFANPAITARVMLLISFSGTVGASVFPRKGLTDFVTGATPLAVMYGEEGALPPIRDMLLGLRGGALGETCIIALVLGGVYLLLRGVITWHTPAAYIGTVFLFTLALGRPAVYEILSGSLVLGAFFMATDYATTPSTPWGKILFGFGCGLMTTAIRMWGSYPEGVSFSILFMNILTPYLEKWTAKKPLGGVAA